MTTIQLLTKNNQQTIRATLESIINLNPRIVVADLGSTDDTIKICREFGAEVKVHLEQERHIIRNKLIETGRNFWIEPWEIVISGHDQINNFTKKSAYVSVLQDKFLTHEIRLFKDNCRFSNPVFEQIENQKAEDSSVLISSHGSFDKNDALKLINDWKNKEPFKPDPYHYHASILFIQGKYDEYLNMADQYLFMDKSRSMSSVMTRYYYAMTYLIHKKEFRPALQNLNLCLCERPLMAEFWCLTGDVYYHLMNRFEDAKEFYENAILMGSRRLKNDKWPMHISKYKSYPLKMIDSCNKIIENHYYVQINRR